MNELFTCFEFLIQSIHFIISQRSLSLDLAHLAAMEGHLACLKFIISTSRDIPAVLSARNDQGETPKSLAEQFYKEDCCNYLDALEWEKDHPEQAESTASFHFQSNERISNIDFSFLVSL